jgi:hypothetical protein
MNFLRSYFTTAAMAAAGMLFATACSTVSSRINDNPQAFQKLPPEQQTLVKEGKILVGFDADAVLLAWGKADNVKPSAKNGKPAEVWTYIGYRQETIQHFDVIPRPVGRNCFVPEPITTPIYVSHPYIRRQALFQNGKVVAWSEGQLP